MANQFFVLGIGGTGMRCIESLIHLCAMGMFDDTTIHLLALDTDKNNGNFARLKELKEAYLMAKGRDAARRTALQDTFFSADIKYYEFSPNYENKSTFKEVFNYGDASYRRKEEANLADLVLTEDVENFNLRHGYRAQTHLGSMMMYHSIIEAAKSNVNNGIKDFVQTLSNAAQNGSPKVFILGSVFGGTGASSIPIIPQALEDATGIISGGAASIKGTGEHGALFGSTLLTAYFNFKSPTQDELQRQKVIATSDKFALNSKVAMMFYDDDKTVKDTYQRFYMMGTEGLLEWNPRENDKDEIKGTITGGSEQRNDSHYIELLAACAALDFYNTNVNTLQENRDNHQTEYIYRAIDDSRKLNFKDFVGIDNKYDEEFAKKFGMLLAFSFLCNGEDDFVEKVRAGQHKEIPDFTDMDVHQVENLKKYFTLFHVASGDNDRLEEGWVRQLHRSAGGGDKFLFNPALFALETNQAFNKFDWNKNLYREEGTGKDWRFKTGLFGSKFNSFKSKFIELYRNGKPERITDRGEQLYKLVYDTLCKIYNIN